MRSLFKKGGQNEYLFNFVNFNPILCVVFSKSVKIAFVNFKGHFLKKT